MEVLLLDEEGEKEISRIAQPHATDSYLTVLLLLLLVVFIFPTVTDS